MEELRHELRFAAVCTVILDALVWLVSVLCIGMTLRVPLGLIAGSAGMFADLLLLRRSVQNAVYHGRTRDMAGYVLRVLIAAAVITAGIKLEQLSVIAAVLPFLYPKVIFGWLAVHRPKKKP